MYTVRGTVSTNLAYQLTLPSPTAESTGASMERMKMPNLETVTKRDSNPGSLDCEFGILPLSYRAPYTLYHDGNMSLVLSYFLVFRIIPC